MISVWAPRAERVDLVIDGDRRVAMDGPDERGWFRAPTVVEAGQGLRVLARRRADPSRSPVAVAAGRRRRAAPGAVDHAAFAWTDAGWRGRPLTGRSVIYELHVGTFSPEGTFDGAIDRLDHLVDLGVDVVELLPVAQFPGRWGWGYDGVDLFAPHEAYGGPDGLKRLVDAAHARGLAVVIDVVYNHLGPAGNYLPEFGPYFTDRYTHAVGRGGELRRTPAATRCGTS